MDIVTMEQVTKVYGENETRVWGLHNVDLTVEKGETLAIVGASGSGKSTLLHVMGGVDTPTSGKIVVDGKDITKMNDEQMSVFRRRKIGFVFQAYHLIPVLSVEENITMPILLDHRKPDKRICRTHHGIIRNCRPEKTFTESVIRWSAAACCDRKSIGKSSGIDLSR